MLLLLLIGDHKQGQIHLQSFPVKVSWHFHTVKISSFTICKRMIFGKSFSSKWHRTASLTLTVLPHIPLFYRVMAISLLSWNLYFNKCTLLLEVMLVGPLSSPLLAKVSCITVYAEEPTIYHKSV